MIKPRKLKKGSKVAIISPSSGLPYLYPEIYELGLEKIREVLQVEVIEMPTARMSPVQLYDNPALRAEDINECFRDHSIDAIFTSIGGYESIRILPHLDTELIMENPKLIMGFSDATTFLAYLNSLGMVTFYGPSVMAGMAQIGNLPQSYTEHLQQFLFSEPPIYHYKPYSKWTNGYKDWSHLETLGQCQPFIENSEGWTFIQGNTLVEGELWGGCIEVLEFMKATPYWVQEDFWQGKILFFETSEEKPTPMQVGYMLRNYGMQGVFSKVKGIIFGRPKDYTAEEKQELDDILVSIIAKEFGASELTVVSNFDFGHTDPKLILPLGCKVTLDPIRQEVILKESPFKVDVDSA
ncbi:S66 peptidase family protein [Alkalihalobacterium bogoriense]|uniref:S66 peptidase family protein n=1 Tax=Alkalihalobacterium bogoriense TaxID=246272 RepID=UPI00047A8DB0|nr:S66 peptidase family protein [Alkalihalobacterium bogoriense]